jgi:UDP-N-acetylmuramoyl-tripeptide--D-alanyl-D-alanine ligase
MPGGVSVINDAFNANPESMQAGLRTFAEWSQGRRTIAVLGEMRELGPEAEAAHHAVGRLTAELGIKVLVVIGGGTVDALAQAAADGPFAPQIRNVACTGDLDAELAQLIKPGDAVFIKASGQSASRTSAQRSHELPTLRQRTGVHPVTGRNAKEARTAP